MPKKKMYAGKKPKTGHCGMDRNKLNTLKKVRDNQKGSYYDSSGIRFPHY